MSFGALPSALPKLDAGEAIVFTYGLDVELDNGLSSGGRESIQKTKGKYRLRDFAERGTDKKLGLPDDQGHAAPLIDVLHRILWLTENEPRSWGISSAKPTWITNACAWSLTSLPAPA